MRRLTLMLLLALAFGFTACAQKRNANLLQNNLLTGNFPGGEAGETVEDFGTAAETASTPSQQFVQSATQALNTVTPYPANLGVPPSYNLDQSSFAVPIQGPQFGTPLVANQFQPPAQGLLVLDSFPQLQFGDVAVGSSSTRTLRVANFGRTAVMLLALQLNGTTGEYAHVSNTCQPVMVPMAECSIELRFTPSQKGPRPQVLRLVYLKPDGSFDATYRHVEGAGTAEPHIVSTGRYHACSAYEGKAYCWGLGNQGQLGDGNETNSHVPTQVYSIPGKTSDLSTGFKFSCAVVDGGAKCWGHNNYGQLGNGGNANNVAPVPVQGLSAGVTQLETDYYHTCAVVNGGVQCWGANWYGALGNNTTTHSSVPVPVVGLQTGVKQVAAGRYHSCALLENGTVKCWGYNNYGQLGTGNTTAHHTPVLVPGLNQIVQIEAGFSQTCAVRQNGQLQCWGYNGYGELGDGTTTHRSSPTLVSGMGSGVSHVAVGPYQTCAIQNQQAKCWGWNAKGGLGNGSTATLEKTPVNVTGSYGVTHLDVHYGYACGVISGRTHCWGFGEHGKLGNGSTADKLVPFPVTPLGAFQ